MYNLPIGLFIGWAIYNLAWHRLDFGYFNAFYSIVFQWTVIFGSGLAFAVSPVFRCATICVCLGGLSKSGQGLLTLYVVEQIQQGPVDNILYNIELTANIIVCHLELQGQLVKQKMSLMTGPVEALFEKHFGTGVSVGKKTVAMLKSLIEPFNDQLGIENDEDKELANVLDGQKAMAERDRILNEESTTTEETATTVTTESNFKSKPSLGKLNSNRMEQRCEATYAMAARQCKDRFSDAQAKCYDSLPLIGLIVCWQFNSDDFCKPSKMEEVARKTCAKFTKSNKTDADMNDKMQNLNELKEQLDNELKVNLHFKVIEQPRDERIRMLAEIMATLRSDLDLIRVISKSTNELLSAFLIFLVYMIFKGAVNMIRSYLTDINFKNIFLSQYFWRIDYKRMLMGQIYLGKVKRSEKKVYHLKHMFGLPTSAELYKTWKALLQFVLLLFLVGCIVAFDHVLYRILSIITEFLTAEAEQTGRHVVDVQVVGNGSIAEMVRSIIQFNYTDTQQRELSNKVCMVSPKQLDQRQFVYNILLPLVVMFALQVLLNYIVTRLVLFYVIGFIFRSRSKQRTVYLYNKVLARRLNDRRLAIARVKYLVVEDELDPVVVKEPKNRISRFFYQFKQLKCVLCLTKHRISSMGFCEDCKTYYCTECMEILEDSCLVCDTRSNMK
ncbi:unnamed protein product [Bursaphelenchus okinawaensis]|uniref:Dendritic cell-specific transmembrane protein-like domain-containing protein n=1 Tax=Bursaphelenchus okinawaensis TaxID=465554 RepID=A0A811L371_9BILA|nr:unnamed protein product [Bursaphelenchus okinawaensis]CAG9116611.1 unnamed protein product [Bursaphelenchus okinawaensis]